MSSRPRAAAPYLTDNPLHRLARAAFAANRARHTVPRTVADLAAAAGVPIGTVRAWLYGRRRCTDPARLAAALQLAEHQVREAADATWEMRPEGAGHG